MNILNKNIHSHKKRKNSLEGSLDLVLFGAELELLVLVLRYEDTSTQATSEFIKCKHWMCRKFKTVAFFMWPASWRTDISSFYYSDINLFLIGYSCSKLCNTWLLVFENNCRIYHYRELHTRGKTLLQLLLKLGWKMTIWKGKLKTELFIPGDYSY